MNEEVKLEKIQKYVDDVIELGNIHSLDSAEMCFSLCTILVLIDVYNSTNPTKEVFMNKVSYNYDGIIEKAILAKKNHTI